MVLNSGFSEEVAASGGIRTHGTALSTECSATKAEFHVQDVHIYTYMYIHVQIILDLYVHVHILVHVHTDKHMQIQCT